MSVGIYICSRELQNKVFLKEVEDMAKAFYFIDKLTELVGGHKEFAVVDYGP